MDTYASEIIRRLGGPAAVARLCEITVQATCQWQTSGIPKGRLLYLKAVRPDVFEPNPTATEQASA